MATRDGDVYPPIPTTEQEWRSHWWYHQHVIQQRDEAIAESAVVRLEVSNLRDEARRLRQRLDFLTRRRSAVG